MTYIKRVISLLAVKIRLYVKQVPHFTGSDQCQKSLFVIVQVSNYVIANIDLFCMGMCSYERGQTQRKLNRSGEAIVPRASPMCFQPMWHMPKMRRYMGCMFCQLEGTIMCSICTYVTGMCSVRWGKSVRGTTCFYKWEGLRYNFVVFCKRLSVFCDMKVGAL